MRNFIRKLRQEKIEADTFFLESAIKKAPAGDPSDEDMAGIYAMVRRRRKKNKR